LYLILPVDGPEGLKHVEGSTI